MGEKIDIKKISAWDLGQIFLVGEGRYDLIDLEKVYSFFFDSALIMEKEPVSLINPKFEESEIAGPQKKEKAICLEILKEKGLTFDGFEKDIGWGKPDILVKDKNESLIAVECGPCRLSKAIDYFRIKNLIELWLVHIYYEEKCIYIIKRGQNWENYLKYFDKKREEQLRKIKSPLDK